MSQSMMSLNEIDDVVCSDTNHCAFHYNVCSLTELLMYCRSAVGG